MNVYDKAMQYGLYGMLEGTDRQSNGQTIFVDSTNGSNTAGGTWGQSWDTPYATVSYAISKCTTGAGDVIFVAAAHTENISADGSTAGSGSTTGIFSVDKGDVSIIGLGRGTKRPTFSFTTAAAAGVYLIGTSPNVLLNNLVFIGNYTNGVTSAMSIAANCYGATIENCDFRETANTKENLIAISIAALCEDVVIRGNKFHSIAGGTDSAVVKTAGAAPNLAIYDNYIDGDYSGPVFDLDAVALSLDMDIHDNVINNVDAAAGIVIGCHANSTGAIYDNKIKHGLPGSAVITAAAAAVFGNVIEDVYGKQGNFGPSCAVKAYTNWTEAKHTLFTIEGGPVLVTGFVGVVTATIKSASIDINLDMTPTSPGTDVVMGTALVIDGDAVGTSYSLNPTFGGVLIATTPGALADTGWDNFIATIGAITMECAGGAAEDGGGTIEWSISYTPLSPGARVLPAATD